MEPIGSGVHFDGQSNRRLALARAVAHRLRLYERSIPWKAKIQRTS